MTLSELRYIIAVARERHSGRAAETCFVSQPTPIIAVKELEDELGVSLYARGTGEVTVTDGGQRGWDYGVTLLARAVRAADLDCITYLEQAR